MCAHVKRYYSSVPGVMSHPPIFWEFDSASLPEGSEAMCEIGDTGDPCHYNIKNLSKNRAHKFFKANSDGKIKVCACSGIVDFNPEIISFNSQI